jgi:large subunit ribosomal protein L13
MKKQNTYYAKPADIKKNWIEINAEDKILGRLASSIASIVRGKNNPQFTPSVDTGDFVVVYNAEKIVVTGSKKRNKFYYNHSGYPGGLKKTSYSDLISRKPQDVLYRAVKGMLPHNRLGRQLIKKVKIYAGSNHPHNAQIKYKQETKREV